MRQSNPSEGTLWDHIAKIYAIGDGTGRLVLRAQPSSTYTFTRSGRGELSEKSLEARWLALLGLDRWCFCLMVPTGWVRALYDPT